MNREMKIDNLLSVWMTASRFRFLLSKDQNSVHLREVPWIGVLEASSEISERRINTYLEKSGSSENLLEISSNARKKSCQQFSHSFEFNPAMSLHMLKKMCKEGAYYGAIAGAYVGMEYGMERIRGKRDWKNAMLGGVITGGLVSAASNKKKDQVIVDAITGGAIAAAADFISQLT